jgi:hypothetical protein
MFFIYKIIFGISDFDVWVTVRMPDGGDHVYRVVLDITMDGNKMYETVRRTIKEFEGGFDLELESGENICEDTKFVISKQILPQQTIIMRYFLHEPSPVGQRVLLRKLKKDIYNNQTATIVKRVTDESGKKLIWVRLDGSGKLLEMGEKHGVQIPSCLKSMLA